MCKPYTKFLLCLPLLFLASTQLSAQAKQQNVEILQKTKLHVFLLIGGINMEGRGEIEEVDEKDLDDTLIWDPFRNRWTGATVRSFLSRRNREFQYWGKLNPRFVRAYKISNPGVRVGIISAPRNHQFTTGNLVRVRTITLFLIRS